MNLKKILKSLKDRQILISPDIERCKYRSISFSISNKLLALYWIGNTSWAPIVLSMIQFFARIPLVFRAFFLVYDAEFIMRVVYILKIREIAQNKWFNLT